MRQNLKPYIFIFLITAFLLLGSVAAFNALVDPYGMYRVFEREGINVVKPAIYSRVRLLKAYEVRRLKPQSIVLGTSRVHLGISPRHEGWAAQYDDRYNLAFDGATTKEMYAYLKHAHAAGRLKHVLLGLDTYHLSSASASMRPDFDPGLLLDKDKGFNTLRMLAADFKLLTSISTLKESYVTLEAQAASDPVWLAPDGQRLGDVFFRRPSENFTKCGPRCYFDEIDKLEVRFKLGWKIPPQKGQIQPIQAAPPMAPDPLTSLDYIQKIIDYCRNHHIELAVFLTPSHVHQLELDALTDNWRSIENGKRKIVSMLEGTGISLYDFTGYSNITTEPLPPKESRQEMRYYWDSSHFKENVGDMVLDCIFGATETEEPMRNDFCLLLTATNLENTITELNKNKFVYGKENQREMNQLKQWIREFKEHHNIVE